MSKGSLPRPVEKAKFDDNFDRIFRRDKPAPEAVDPLTCCEKKDLEIALLKEELDMRDQTKICRECHQWLTDGEAHSKDCKYWRLDSRTAIIDIAAAAARKLYDTD